MWAVCRKRLAPPFKPFLLSTSIKQIGSPYCNLMSATVQLKIALELLNVKRTMLRSDILFRTSFSSSEGELAEVAVPSRGPLEAQEAHPAAARRIQVQSSGAA